MKSGDSGPSRFPNHITHIGYDLTAPPAWPHPQERPSVTLRHQQRRASAGGLHDGHHRYGNW